MNKNPMIWAGLVRGRLKTTSAIRAHIQQKTAAPTTIAKSAKTTVIYRVVQETIPPPTGKHVVCTTGGSTGIVGGVYASGGPPGAPGIEFQVGAWNGAVLNIGAREGNCAQAPAAERSVAVATAVAANVLKAMSRFLLDAVRAVGRFPRAACRSSTYSFQFRKATLIAGGAL